MSHPSTAGSSARSPAALPAPGHALGAPRPSRRVLILDHGLGFGGTVVVAATLMHHLDPSRYSAVLVSAADKRFLAARMRSSDEVIPLAPRYTYVHAQRLREACLRLPVLGRLANSAISRLFAMANWPYLARLALLMRRERVEVVHCNNFANREGLLLAWLLDTPCILHAHGFANPSRDAVSGWLIRRLQPLVVAISKAVAVSVETCGMPASAIRVLHNPLSLSPTHDTSALDFRRTLGVPESALLVGIVGRVVRWKGQFEFVAACIEALRRHPSLHAVIVGDASDYDDSYLREVRALAAGSVVAERIHFSGFVADTDAIYEALDILVHASIEPEPFGLVITEAMAQGVAVIAASSGAPLELIAHGLTGFIVNPSDTKALAAHIEALAADATLRRSVAEAGQQHALSAFDPREYAQAFADIYDHAVARRSTGATAGTDQ